MDLLFQKLAEKAESDKLAAEHEWQTVVGKLANNAATEREVAAALKSSGRPLADLQAAVKKQRRIAELKAVVEASPDVIKKLEETLAAETEFNLARQVEFVRNRDVGFAIRSAAMEARANFDAIAVAQRELDSLIDTPVELPLGEVA
jgi:hypothetical protein